jgi:hypothetical protein
MRFSSSTTKILGTTPSMRGKMMLSTECQKRAAGLTKTDEQPVLIDGYRILEIDEASTKEEADDETAKEWSLPLRVI